MSEEPRGETRAGNRLQELAVGERPQERLERQGAGALSDAELLAMLLRSGTRGQDVLTLATRLVSEAGSLGGLIAWKERDYRRMKGIGRIKALQMIAVMEVARRVLRQQGGESPLLDSTEAVAAHFAPLIAGLEVEKFWTVCLNRKNRLLKCVEVSSGTASNSLAHPREVFREAIREGALAIVCVHNHPSGDPSPSSSDIQITRQLREAAKTIGIDLLDHVVLGQPGRDPAGVGHYSFRAAGLL